MKVYSINNSHQQSFGARFPKEEINTLISAALSDKKGAGIPKLYTLLDLLDKRAGRVAGFKTHTKTSRYVALGAHGPFHPSTTTYELYADNVKIKEGIISKLSTLYHAMTDFHPKTGEDISMPQPVFDTMWWKNVSKTIDDVLKFALK